MEPRNLAWLRRILSGIVNFNSGQTDQNFNTENDEFYHLDDALTEAYALEINEAKVMSVEPFKKTAQLTWESGDSTFVLPDYLNGSDLIEIHDVTDNAVGTLLVVGNRQAGHTVYWKTENTLQWGVDGPGEDKTLEMTYVGSGTTFKKPLQEPDLIPYRFRHLLPWSAAVVISSKAEQKPPQFWLTKLDEWRTSWYSAITRGRPMHQNVPRVHNTRRRR